MGDITRKLANNILGTGEIDATDGLSGTVAATNIGNTSLDNLTSTPTSLGYAIKSVASDPPSLNAGEIFYNSTSGAFKALVNVEAWSSASPVITANGFMGYASEGTQTAGLLFGGYNTGGPPYQRNITESYNGSGWTSEANINTARNDGHGFGSQTSAGFVNGTNTPSTRTSVTEEYNGSSWTTVNSNPHSDAYDGVSGGPQTAAWRAGGYTTSPNNTTQLYDGTSWTASNTLGTARYSFGGNGSQTSGIAFGGITGGTRQTVTEEFDGTSWTAGGSYPTSVSGVKGFGYSQTTAVGVGGGTSPPSIVTTTCTYDGSTWTNSSATLADSASAGGVGGSSSAGFYASGIRTAPGTYKASTEEYNSSTNTITAAAWASATAMPRNHGEHIGGSGSASDGLAFGGEGPTNYNYTEEWNGSSWTAGGNWPASDESIMGCGTSGPTTIGFGGIGNIPGTPPVNRQSTSATYDGSSWTTTNSLPVAKRAGQGFGTNTAAVAAGGDTSPTDPQTSVEEWDGTNWTAVTSLPEGKGNMGGGTGTQTAGLVFGGYNPVPAGDSNTTFEYDGTSWTAGGNMNVGRNQVNGWGGPAGQTASICGGGNAGAAVSLLTEAYDGTAWSTKPNLATARQGSANGIGTSQTTGIQAGGSTGSYVTTVEEFTGETVTQVAKTLSSS